MAGEATASDAATVPQIAPPVRVLHVAEAFGGGLYEMVRVLADGTAAAGHEVAIAYGRRPETPADPSAALRPDVVATALPWGERSIRSQARAVRELRAVAAAWQPDVIHLHSSIAGVVGGIALHGVAPIVYTPHSFASCLPGTRTPQRTAMRAGERLAIRCADHVGAVSASEAECAVERGARRVTTVLNGIPELDVEPLEPPDVDRELARLATPAPPRPRVIAAGRMVSQRRPHECAEILCAVAGDADVAWVGGGGEDTPWSRDARAALQRSGVACTGWVPRETFLDELRAATVYLHWTAWDGHPLSLLEALANDAVIVASDIPPNREVVPAEQLCRTEAEAAELIRWIVDDAAFAGQLRRNQRRAAARFGARRMVAEWLELYGALAGRPAPVADRPSVPAPADRPAAAATTRTGTSTSTAEVA